MATNAEKIQEFAQQVYLTIYGRRIDDIDDTDGVEAVEKTKIWLNLFLDELEREADWNCVRENDATIGTVQNATSTFDLPGDARKLVADENRPLVIMNDGAIISIWDVVDPNQLTSRNHYGTRDQRVTYVNQRIVFSRALNDTEIGSTVMADIVNTIPRIASNDTSLFDLPLPRQLLVLGTAKNNTLPDIVQGGLSPSYVQKYNDELEKAKAENDAAGLSSEAVTEDNGNIAGVY